jgi:hypothetical protein
MAYSIQQLTLLHESNSRVYRKAGNAHDGRDVDDCTAGQRSLTSVLQEQPAKHSRRLLSWSINPVRIL